MSTIQISETEKQWLKEDYSQLEVRESDPVEIVGVLEFDMFYDEKNDQYIINPSGGCTPKANRIKDGYQIKILLSDSEFSSLPQVREIGGRLKKIVEKKGLKPEDFHINPNGTVCLCSRLEEKKRLPDGFNLKDFLYNLVIPFFYGQSYFEKNSRWPWGQYSHGDLGLLESYADNKEAVNGDLVNECLSLLKKYKRWKKYEQLLKKKDDIKGHWQCICGSSLKFRKCHPKVLKGLWKLKRDINSFSMLEFKE